MHQKDTVAHPIRRDTIHKVFKHTSMISVVVLRVDAGAAPVTVHCGKFKRLFASSYYEIYVYCDNYYHTNGYLFTKRTRMRR